MNSNSNIDKFKNKKIILGTMTLISVVAIVFVISLFPFVLDPAKIFTLEWWTDEIILIVLTIFSVVCVMFIGQASNSQNPLSNIAKAKADFKGLTRSVARNSFEQWVERVMQPHDQLKIYRRALASVALKQESIIDLSRSDIKSLVGSPQRIDGVWYDEITQKQFEKVMEIKNGKYNIKFVDASYYLTDKSLDSELTRSERAKNESKKHSMALTLSLMARIIILLIVSLTLGMFTRDLMANQDVSVSLMRLFSRLSTICSGAFVGYLTGCQDNDISAGYIEMKCDVIREQMADKDFVVKSVEEMAKDKFAKKVKLLNAQEIEDVRLLNNNNKEVVEDENESTKIIYN